MAIRVTPNSEQIPINVVGSSSFGDYPKISNEKTYNMFESDGWLISFPGYHKVVQLIASGNQGRGLFRSFRGNRMIAVVDSNVYDIDDNMSATLVGHLATSIGEVFMDENLDEQIAIVDGLNIYIYNYALPSGVVVQTGTPLGNDLIPNYVTYHNSFFLIGNANKTGVGQRWYVYERSDDTHIVERSSLSIQTKPDTALAIKRIPGQASNVLVFGGSVCEVYTQVGGLNNLGVAVDYQKNSSVSIDYGCLSVSTIAESDTHIAWLGINEANLPVIMVMTGQSTSRVSTDGIDFFIQSLQHPEQSTAMMYRINGHLFYHLTFFAPEDNTSLIYDFNTEKFYHLSDHNLNYHPARQLVFFNANDQFNSILDGVAQNIFFISINGGNIYQLSQEFTTIIEDINNNVKAGTDPNLEYEMQRIRICKSIRFPTSAPFKVNQFCFTIEQGQQEIPPVQDCLVYLISETGIRLFSEDPSYVQLVAEGGGSGDCYAIPYQGRVDLAISKDGTDAYSNYVPRYLNPTGQHKNILRWNKMGRANELVPKIRFWTKTRVTATGGYVEVTT
jgi:hypothetical protein